MVNSSSAFDVSQYSLIKETSHGQIKANGYTEGNPGTFSARMSGLSQDNWITQNKMSQTHSMIYHIGKTCLNNSLSTNQTDSKITLFKASLQTKKDDITKKYKNSNFFIRVCNFIARGQLQALDQAIKMCEIVESREKTQAHLKQHCFNAWNSADLKYLNSTSKKYEQIPKINNGNFKELMKAMITNLNDQQNGKYKDFINDLSKTFWMNYQGSDLLTEIHIIPFVRRGEIDHERMFLATLVKALCDGNDQDELLALLKPK